MLFERTSEDKTVAKFTNEGGYILRVLARLGSPRNAQYYITVEEPSEEEYHVGYMATIDQFKEIGLLLLAFSKFAEEKIRVGNLTPSEFATIYSGLTRNTVIKYAVKHSLLKRFLSMIKEYKN